MSLINNPIIGNTLDGPKLTFILNYDSDHFKNPIKESIFNTGDLYDESKDRFVKSIRRCIDDHHINLGENINCYWYPLREAYARQLNVERWKYPELSFYDVRWSYLFYTVGQTPEEFRAFIILRNNIKVHGTAYALIKGDLSELPDEINYDTVPMNEVGSPYAPVGTLADAYNGKGNTYGDGNDEKDYLIPRNIDTPVCGDDWNFPLIKTIPITIEDYDSAVKERKDGKDWYDTLYMKKVFQNCLSAQYQMDNDHYMNPTAKQFARMFHRTKSYKEYEGIELPFDPSECTAKNQPTNDGAISPKDIAEAAKNRQITESAVSIIAGGFTEISPAEKAKNGLSQSPKTAEGDENPGGSSR